MAVLNYDGATQSDMPVDTALRMTPTAFGRLPLHRHFPTTTEISKSNHIRMTVATFAFVFLMPHVVAVASMPPQGQNSGSKAADSKQTADYSKESSVVQTLHTAVSFRDDGTATREETARIQIQSEGGIEDWGLLSFSFNSANQDVEIGYVRVLEPDGTIVSTPLRGCQ